MKPNKKCPISWKIIEPFVEKIQDEKKYGFRISQGIVKRHFYVKSLTELDDWLDRLSRVAIMTDIKNDFDFKSLLGTGSYSYVYLATDLENGQEYAIKCIPKYQLQSIEHFSALINEIEIMKSLDHPRIIKIHKIYESPHHVHLVLDYAQGGDLFQRIGTNGPITEKKAIILIKNLLNVIEYLNSKNIVHRDIKLQNIFMVSKNNDTEIKLGDFGLSCINTEKLTQICGSPGFTAPEILKRDIYGSKVDVFSVGIVLFMLLTGKTPWSAKNKKELVLQNRDCKVPFAEALSSQNSREMIKLVKKLMMPNPNSRPSASQILRSRYLREAEDSIRPRRRSQSVCGSILYEKNNDQGNKDNNEESKFVENNQKGATDRHAKFESVLRLLYESKRWETESKNCWGL
ncbi:unnamed protein product [Blepharisma stoltei]|uniref:Protein kinase domain-containing protein n=1 Tax=Blepharisma stoltei TaxID=1481888 RepID=A0AAU9K291_9CILI|nr:unnamed protein product [Blepharisma stoltei]